MSDYRDVLSQLETTVNRLTRTSIPDDGNGVAAIGQIKATAKRLADFARSLEAETPKGLSGGGYRSVDRGKNAYSFNLTRMVADAMDTLEIADVNRAYRRLSEEGVIRLEVAGVRAVEKFYHAHDMELVVAAHEVEDGDLDEAHVGKVWKANVKVEAES